MAMATTAAPSSTGSGSSSISSHRHPPVPSNNNKKQKSCKQWAYDLYSLNEWTPHVEELAKLHARRCHDMLDLEEQIRQLQDRLEGLKADQKKLSIMVDLSKDAKHVWPTLTTKEKWSKQNIVAALTSKKLPPELEECRWVGGSIPLHLREDRDVRFALLQRKSTMLVKRLTDVVPRSLWDDKELMVQAVKCHPEIVARGLLDDRYLLDQDIFRSAFLDGANSRNYRFLSDTDVLRFSEQIRSDPGLMLGTLRRIAFVDKKCYVSKSLLNQKEFVLKVAHDLLHDKKESPMVGKITLKLVSQRLRADIDVVQAFCGANGRNLQFAAHGLRRHVAVIRCACLNDPLAMKHALPSRAKNRLLTDKEFVLTLLDKAASLDQLDYVKFIEVLGSNWIVSDRDVAVAILANCKLLFSSVLDQWGHDEQFWSAVLRKRPVLWVAMPETLMSNVELSLTAARNIDIDSELIFLAMLEVVRHDVLMTDRDVIRNMVQRMDERPWKVLLHFVPRDILERNFVLELCRLNAHVYELLDFNLWDDREIVQTVLEKDPSVIEYVPAPTQSAHPDIMAKAILDYGKSGRDVNVLADTICERLWMSREVVMAWFSSGGHLLDRFPDEFQHDKELMVLLAKRSPSQLNLVSPRLRHNREFMLAVAATRGKSLLSYAHPKLQSDYKLMFAAISNDLDVILDFERRLEGRRELTDFAEQVRKRVATQMGFLTVLAAISLESGPESNLKVLNQGKETTLVLKRLLAAYTGVTRGEELRSLRKVSVALAKRGY